MLIEIAIYNCCKLLLSMASIAIMAGGALLNAVAFMGGNYLAGFLSGEDSSAALEEKVRHDKAFESYQEAYTKYEKDRTKLLDWIAANEWIKEQAKQNFTDTDYAFKLYNQVHLTKKYCLCASQSSLISISLASSKTRRAPVRGHWCPCTWLRDRSFSLNFSLPYLYGYTRWTPNLCCRLIPGTYTTAPVATGKVLPPLKNYPRPPRFQKILPKSGWSSRRFGRSTFPRHGAYLDRNSMYPHPTRSTKPTFFFCRTANSPSGAKFSNMR